MNTDISDEELRIKVHEHYIHGLAELCTQAGDMGWGKLHSTARQRCLVFLAVKEHREGR